MRPGSKLDATIARKVMGWRSYGDQWAIGPKPKDRIKKKSLWRPSRDLKAAMEVFDHLRGSGNWCCLKISSDYNYSWELSLTRAEHLDRLDKKSPNPQHKPQIFSQAKFLPFAICKLAIRAMGVK